MAVKGCRHIALILLMTALGTGIVIDLALAGSGITMQKISTMMFMMDIKVNPAMQQKFFNALGLLSKKNGFKLDLVEMPPDEGCISVILAGDDIVLDGISELGGPDGA